MRKTIVHLFAAVFAVVSVSFPATAAEKQDTAAGNTARPDTTVSTDKGPAVTIRDTSALLPGQPAAAADSGKAIDSVATMGKQVVPSPLPDTLADSLLNAVNFDSATIIGAGLGLSVGSTPLFALWKKGLPLALAGLGVADTSFRQSSDSASLVFTLKEDPDIYNMMFPVSISLGRSFPESRIGAALSFSMLSKKYTSSIGAEADSSGRRIDIRQRLAAYTVALDLLYGKRIPERYFSVDGVDRTDAIIGLSIAPLAVLAKTSSIQSNATDPRFSALADSLEKTMNSFSSYGIAIGWRAGISTLKRLSKQGGVEAGITYYGAWSGRFRSRGAPLREEQVSQRGTSGKEVSSFSSRVEISVALVRKVFAKPVEP